MEAFTELYLTFSFGDAWGLEDYRAYLIGCDRISLLGA